MPRIEMDRSTRCTPRVWGAALALGAAAALSGCVVAPVDGGPVEYGYTSTTVYTHYGHPPPPRVEYRSRAPSPHHVWMGGNWMWNGGRYDWRPGYWAGPGFRPAPVRPMVQPPPPRPPVMPRPAVRPDERPHPVQVAPASRPPVQQLRPPSGPRPLPQARPDAPPRAQMPARPAQPPQARPLAPRSEQARPAAQPRSESHERRGAPLRPDRDDERRPR